jgi:hypothetical protein
MSDAVETLKRWITNYRCPDEVADAIREVLAMVEDCERDHPPEPWASELEAKNERLRAQLKQSSTARAMLAEHELVIERFKIKAALEKLRNAIRVCRSDSARAAIRDVYEGLGEATMPSEGCIDDAE